MYSTCKECFNKKVRCEFCNEEIKKELFKIPQQETTLVSASLRTGSHTGLFA